MGENFRSTPRRGKFPHRFFTGILITFALAHAIARGTCSAQTLARRNPPPVILISIDTLRADHLGCYGYRRIRTPHLDAFTRGGTLFTQVSAQVPLTLPSHVSLLTSTNPFANGVEDNMEQLKPNAVTLATLLKANGYRTAAFVGGFVLDRRFGLNQGFDVYDSPFDISRSPGQDPGDVKRLGEIVVQAASQWVERNSDSPFFLFLHLYDLHTPYIFPPHHPRLIGRAGYDAEIAYVDEAVGQFWNFLDKHDLLKKAVIMLVSDHGEGLGDHGEGAHGYFIYQSTLWVPLIIHWPSEVRPFPSEFRDPINLLDLAPTILQFLNIHSPPQFQGRSLLSSLLARSSFAGEDVYAESIYGSNHFGVARLRSIRAGRYKYIAAPKPELYDLLQDPNETRNLFTNQKSIARSLQDRLSSLRSRFRQEPGSGPRVLGPDVVERLRSLGYVAVSSPRTQANDTGVDPKDRIEAFEEFGRAQSLASRGRLRESVAVCVQLLAQHPELIDVRIVLGLALQQLGEQEAAAKEFQRVLQGDPLNVLAHFDLGMAYFALGRTDDAIREFQATLAIAPYYTRADEMLGVIFLDKQDLGRARTHFEHLLTFAPNDFTARYNLGVLAIREGRWDDALSSLRAAVGADPQSPEAHNSLGSLYFLRGDLDGAQRQLTEAIQWAPNFALAHYNLGLVFQKRAQSEKAAQQFRLALQADPKFTAAREALGNTRNPP